MNLDDMDRAQLQSGMEKIQEKFDQLRADLRLRLMVDGQVTVDAETGEIIAPEYAHTVDTENRPFVPVPHTRVVLVGADSINHDLIRRTMREHNVEMIPMEMNSRDMLARLDSLSQLDGLDRHGNAIDHKTTSIVMPELGRIDIPFLREVSPLRGAPFKKAVPKQKTAEDHAALAAAEAKRARKAAKLRK